MSTLGCLVRDLATRHRALTLARHAVFTEAATNPALRRRVVEGKRKLTAWATPIVAALGLPDPARQLTLLLALIEGLLTNQLADPEPDFDPEAAIAALLRGMRTAT